MAATNYTPISLYYSTTASAVPLAANLVNGELALNINTADGKLYYKDSAGNVQLLASKSAATASVSSVAISVPSIFSVTGSPITTSGTLAISYSGTALPVANGGTNATSAGITAFNNITGYTASGATGTTSTNLVFSNSPTLVSPALGTPTSGNLSNCTADGTNAVGFLNIPQNAQTGSYTTVLADAGKHIYHASGAGAATYTIAANSSVAYPIGTVISFVNLSSTSISIAITTDTLYLGNTGTTGTRTLAQYGVANALKITSTAWIITGTALT
jgi:hypothetical protein